MATRARTNNNIPAPDQRGWRGKMVLTKISQIWNKIPNNIKMEDKAHLAKKHIKNCPKNLFLRLCTHFFLQIL